MNYIAYYRVSTKKQGDSGLGLASQKTAVENFLRPEDKLLAEYQEVESGTKTNRKELTKAIVDCRKHDATLLVAKLDRLARNVEFVYKLKNSSVKFISLDNPEANNITVGLLAVMAEEENRLRSERITDALAEIKRKNRNGIPHYSKSGRMVKKLGGTYQITDEDRKKSTETIKRKARENQNNKVATAYIISLIYQDKNFSEIATELNNNGFKTSRGKEFTSTQVKRLYERNKNNRQSSKTL